ncbi:hypothetical protein PoB_001770100 [Plakobranchus ocellatus]|uniref:Uncharacterized protein n=1 Tax=Plakobranchus ocellatus TaxID=259542 RepID=A0AAV3Z990_9GAST|nr:hypothetical protein PoB_001770100 [Plakobranchus ocellatus]
MIITIIQYHIHPSFIISIIQYHIHPSSSVLIHHNHHSSTPSIIIFHHHPSLSSSSSISLSLSFLYIASPQQGDLRLSGPPSGQGAGSGAIIIIPNASSYIIIIIHQYPS